MIFVVKDVTGVVGGVGQRSLRGVDRRVPKTGDGGALAPECSIVTIVAGKRRSVHAASVSAASCALRSRANARSNSSGEGKRRLANEYESSFATQRTR